jgi:hypothetical protein
MLQFKIIPLIITAHAVIFSVMWINFFPPKGWISNTFLPQAIVTALPPNARKQSKIPYESYAQVHSDNTQSNNAMISKTVGAISLGPTGNIQGTFKFMSLLTGKRIKARLFTPLPMPAEVMIPVERMATFNYPAEQDEAYPMSTSIHGEFQPFLEEEDLSLKSSNYSKISQNELNDIRTENQNESEQDGDAIIPETVLSHNNTSVEASQIQRVNDNINDNHENDNLNDQNMDNYQDTINNDNYDDIKDNLEDDNSFDHEENKDMSEYTANDESSIIHYVTKQGRIIKLRKYRFNN